ncbi:MAG: hypothetical protein LBB25_01225 [Holosporaceae bacterium]|nr:hypothetical protein [Holosporaceae bacterium]
MRNIIRNIISFSLILLLTGCIPFRSGSTGNPVLERNNKAEIYKIIGDKITTKSDARRHLGDPADIDYNNENKQEKWTYLHVNKSNLTRNFIPLFNFFSRGSEDTQKKIILIFNDEGIMVKQIVTESVSVNKDGIFD